MKKYSKKNYKVYLVQQSVWKTTLQSVPLASAYLKAYVIQDPVINTNFDIQIYNFNLSHSNKYIIHEIIKDGPPDILCFSVLGWNLNNFMCISKCYKEIKPDGKIIFGGMHATNQSEKIFDLIKEVDIIINGEGEITFKHILFAFLQNKLEKMALSQIEGISYKINNKLKDNKNRFLINDLDIIPSPYLSGVIPLFNEEGKFLYDVILLETCRGCPYLCAYCSWDISNSGKIRRFSINRLKKELELFGKNKINNIVLCDSNFGLSRHDEIFVDVFIETKKKYGYPTNLETSWALGVPNTMLNILDKLNTEKIKHSFSISLQSLDKNALNNITWVFTSCR
jgi:radical SAM superfamily enzyme YgiQ (UPF0313 family)